MPTLLTKKPKLSTVLSTIDRSLPIPLKDQEDAIRNWNLTAPKISISGPEQPPSLNGLRFVRTPKSAAVFQVLANHLGQTPGTENIMLTNPDVIIGGRIEEFLLTVSADRIGIAWSAYIEINGKPRVFLMSTPVIAHLISDIPHTLNMAGDWQDYVDQWMKRMLRQRYVNATQFGIAEAIPLPTVAPTVAPAPQVDEPRARRANPVRKVKRKVS